MRDDKRTANAALDDAVFVDDEPARARELDVDDESELRAVLAETHEILRAQQRDLVAARARAQLRHDPREVEWDWDLAASRIDVENMEAVFGWEPTPSADVTSWILGIHDDDRGRVIAGLHAAIDGGEGFWRDEYRHLRADGTFTVAASRAIVLRDGAGQATRLIGITRDASAARREESARYAHLRRVEAIAGVSRAVTRAGLALPQVLDTVVRAVADVSIGSAAVHFLSEDRATLQPPAASFDVDPVRGALVRDAMTHSSPAHAGIAAHVVASGERVVIPVVEPASLARGPHPLAGLFEVVRPRSVIVTPLRVRGDVIGVLTAARYDHDSRPFDHDDGLVIQEIADLAACAIASARMYARADRLLRFAEIFVGILGHDLRNPLHAIATSAQIILRADDVERTIRPARRIAQSASRMARMIDQLLDFTRIRVGGLTLQRAPVNVADICQDVVDELTGSQGAPEVDVLVRGDTVGSFDPDRLSQLVSNLVANALTHGDPDGPVSVGVAGEAPGEVVIEVRNGGVIAAELLPAIFEPLNGGADGASPETSDDAEMADHVAGVRMARRRSKRSGLGLGLFIVQQIARAHGGDVAVDSRPGDGTCFRVWLPRRTS